MHGQSWSPSKRALACPDSVKFQFIGLVTAKARPGNVLCFYVLLNDLELNLSISEIKKISDSLINIRGCNLTAAQACLYSLQTL